MNSRVDTSGSTVRRISVRSMVRALSPLVPTPEVLFVLAVVVTILGNFWFDGSTLRGQGNSPDLALTAILEPASMLLLGAGLLIVARRAAMRRRASRKG